MQYSVIICTYNRANDLAKVLDQLCKQSKEVDVKLEFLVIDNNSTDQTQEIVIEFAEQYHHVRYLFEDRQGKPFALNTAIQQAKGDWLFFTDDDVVFDDHWLKAMINAVNIYSFKCFFGKIIPLWPMEKPDWYDPRMGSVIVNADHGNSFKDKMNYMVGANMGIHKDIFKQYGGFNEKIKRFEDSELSLRLREKVNIAYVPDAVVYHPVTPSRVNKLYFKKWYFEMGRIIDLRLFAQQHKKILGIPRWVYRAFLKQLFLSLKSIDPKIRFYHQLQVWRYLGSFQEKWFNANVK